MKSHEKLPRQFPHNIKVANVVVKIYRGKTRGYDLFTVIHYSDGKRNRKVFASFAEARSHAQEVATQIARGRVNVLSLTSADRDSYVATMRLVEPLGIPLHVAVEEYAAARSHLQDESLLSAVKAYAKRSRNHHDKPVAVVVAEL